MKKERKNGIWVYAIIIISTVLANFIVRIFFKYMDISEIKSIMTGSISLNIMLILICIKFRPKSKKNNELEK
jgi:hypothetical protein